MAGERKTAIWVAVIGLAGTITAAIITGVFGLTKSASPAATPATSTPTIVHQSPTASPVDVGAPLSNTEKASPTPLVATYLSSVKPLENVYTTVVAGSVEINTSTFEQSIRFTCEGGQSSVVYNVTGYGFLNATIGVPNDATNAAGNVAVITFLKNGDTQLGTPITDTVGQH